MVSGRGCEVVVWDGVVGGRGCKVVALGWRRGWVTEGLGDGGCVAGLFTAGSHSHQRTF